MRSRSPARRAAGSRPEPTSRFSRLSAAASSPMTQLAASFGSPSSSRTTSDRKSTRLNSSRITISYAVFCLKKKNNLQKRQYEKSHRADSAFADEQSQPQH